MGDERDSSSSEEESEEETTTEEESGSESDKDDKNESTEKNNVVASNVTKQSEVSESQSGTKKQVIESPRLSVPNSSSSPSIKSRPSSPFSQPRKMTHQRKQNLKSMMLNKAREDLKKEAEHQAEEKKAVLQQRLVPLANLADMDQQELMDLCRELNSKMESTDEQRYDLEVKVRKYDAEIDDLNQRINDLRGKFKRPPLRRVRMSADQMLRALLGSKHKVSMDLRSNLKAVKKEENKKDDVDVKDWRENVEAKTGMGGKKAVFEGQ